MATFDHLFLAPTNFDQSLAFYRDSLGWSVVSSWGSDNEPRGAVLVSDGGCKLVMAEEHDDRGDDAWEPNRGFVLGQPVLHVNVPDVDTISFPPGTDVRIAPVNNHWGGRWCVVADPDGNLMAFNSPSKA